jgi:hypothetical protein
MTRAWKNEGGYTLVLRTKEGYGANLSLVSSDGLTVLCLNFEYWEIHRAEAAADTLVEFGHMQEVPSGLRIGG